MHKRYYNIIICGHLFALGQFGTAASATTELSKMRDCTEIELEAVIDQDASREDNLARLSQQFFQSVNTVEHCDREQHNVDAASSTKSDSASSSADADGANAASDASAAANSTANTDLASALSEQMTASSDSENPTNIDANNTATDSSASSMAATQNTNQWRSGQHHHRDQRPSDSQNSQPPQYNGRGRGDQRGRGRG